MNRLLLIPLIAVSAGFAALVIVNPNPAAKAVDSGTPPLDIGDRLPDFASVKQSLIAKWDELTPQPYTFSRVMRPQPRYSKPEILVDWECPAPKQVYVGSIRLYQSEIELVATTRHEEYPMFVDRKSGQTAVYWENHWIPYDQWAVNVRL